MNGRFPIPADGKPQFSSFSVPVLKVQDFPGPLWDLQDDFGFYSAIVKEWIIAPKGFRTDGDSIPGIALSLVGYVADEPGYIHDKAYTDQKYSREICDRILREMMIVRGYSAFKAEEFYLAVRAGGASHWSKPNVPQPNRVSAGQLEAA
jgi:hypothetical protein